ncbi:MAG: DeoR family transcriptional regulator [Candidatus Nealsonbacteria bacterium]|nr:MAG: DeoR family transcriptional regulator [Candidatus Nealsonbacteria bacterium]
MDSDYFIQLTANLYRLTLLFPKKEPLRYKMRELADDILANLTSILRGSFYKSKNLILETEKDLEILNGFFEVAKNQNWVSPFDVLEVQKEYSKIGEEIKKLSDSHLPTTETVELPARAELPSRIPSPAGSTIRKEKGSLERNPRQQKILEILKEKGKAQVWELKQIFPEVSKRTLRRDFEQMFNQGLIERMGERNETFYQIKEDRS